MDGVDLECDVHVFAVRSGADDGRLRTADTSGEQHVRILGVAWSTGTPAFSQVAA